MEGNDRSILVVNHQTAADIVVNNVVTFHFNRLHQTRSLFKKALSFVPIAGIGMVERGSVPLQRSSKNSSDLTVISEIVNDVKQHVPGFIYQIFPEGTRRNFEKKDQVEISDSFWAKHKGCKPTGWVICPRSRGFIELRNTCNQDLDYIYDMTIIYRGHRGQNNDFNQSRNLSLYEYFSNNNIEAHVVLNKYKVADFDGNDRGETKLFKCFQEKDRIIDTFYKKGRIEGYQPVLISFSWTKLASTLAVVFLSVVAITFLIGAKNCLVVATLLTITSTVKYLITFK